MNKKYILIMGIGFFLMATICFMEYNQSPSNSCNINSGKEGDDDVLGENYLKIAATDNYTSNFNTTWGGSNYDKANGIIVDGAGNIYITGYTESFGAGAFDAFIAKYKRTIDDSTNAGIPGPTILLIGIISALSIGMILKRLFQTNKLRRI